MRTLARIHQAYRGSSFPVQVQLTNGESCVLKLRGSGNGAASLAAEFVVNHVASRLGLPVPDVFRVQIPNGFPWEFGTDEFDDIVQKSSGPNLGIVSIGPTTPMTKPGVENLPLEFLQKMAALDALFCNYDRTPTSLNVVRDKQGLAWILDHGSCLIFEAPALVRPINLPPNHFLSGKESDYLNPRILFEMARLDLLQEAINEVPQEWLDETGAQRDLLFESLRGRFTRVHL